MSSQQQMKKVYVSSMSRSRFFQNLILLLLTCVIQSLLILIYQTKYQILNSKSKMLLGRVAGNLIIRDKIRTFSGLPELQLEKKINSPYNLQKQLATLNYSHFVSLIIKFPAIIFLLTQKISCQVQFIKNYIKLMILNYKK